MAKLIGAIVGCALVWFIFMGTCWALWCWALPQVYEGGPRNIVSPGFWLFAACFTLIAWLGRAIFGDGKKS